MHKFFRIISALLVTIVFSSCLSLSQNQERQEEKVPELNQLQLQEEIQRLYTRFTERVADAFLKHEKDSTPKSRKTLLQKYLLYDSEALKIATGPYPELNLLDMLVFIKINGRVYESTWLPQHFINPKERTKDIFFDTNKEAEALALKVMSPDELGELDLIIREWFKKNPDQTRVEKVRMGDFEQLFKDIKTPGKKGPSASISNFIVNVRGTIEAVDQVVLVSNRALFLSQQMPFLLRLQTRVGTMEVTDDLLQKVDQINPGLQSMSGLALQVDRVVRDTSLLLREVKDILPEQDHSSANKHKTPPLTQIESILDKAHQSLALLTSQSIDVQKLREAKDGLTNFVWFLALVIFITFCCITVVWWGVYYLVKRQLQKAN